MKSDTVGGHTYKDPYWWKGNAFVNKEIQDLFSLL